MHNKLKLHKITINEKSIVACERRAGGGFSSGFSGVDKYLNIQFMVQKGICNFYATIFTGGLINVPHKVSHQ